MSHSQKVAIIVIIIGILVIILLFLFKHHIRAKLKYQSGPWFMGWHFGATFSDTTWREITLLTPFWGKITSSWLLLAADIGKSMQITALL